ncbi:MAG: 1,3-beta-galactosyl-N-acetylhexosamine phosphorylase C-terminal domain-containing protein [Candidatus Borkfalkiaceae bacterium]|nr:1,3-beta-galactosyl-N-acetylhexosamine phosphorylase C-terminal domain-containing protein [Christensenellaceae bacterium]
MYALINSANEEQTTEFYDKSGYKSIIELKSKEIKWIKGGK